MIDLSAFTQVSDRKSTQKHARIKVPTFQHINKQINNKKMCEKCEN